MDRRLRNVNIGAAALHGTLLISLLAYKWLAETPRTSVDLLDEGATSRDPGKTCSCWPDVGIKTIGVTFDILWALVVFTVVTILAHVVYATDAFGTGAYSASIKSGVNFFRWIEYGMSASTMLAILAVLSGIRNFPYLVVLIIATAALMLQGYFGELAISNGGSIGARLIPMGVGWALLAAVTFAIVWKWFRSVEEAKDIARTCQENSNTGSGDTSTSDSIGTPPKAIEHLIWVIVALFSSFGVVNLVQVIHSFLTSSAVVVKNFAVYELTYIALSFVSKATLVIYCMGSVFGGELVWLQGHGCADANGPCIPFIPEEGSE